MTPRDAGLSGKFISFFRLVDACAAPGCPVCRCLLADSRQYLETLLYEHVNDPDTRRRLRAAWGFCNHHTWMLREISDSAFGSAIICEDMVRVVIQRFERQGRGRAPESPSRWRRFWRLFGRNRRPILVELHGGRPMCPACREHIAAERQYVHVVLGFASDFQFEHAYRRSDGLCVPHALEAVEMGPAGPAEVLMTLTLPKWAAVRGDLATFIEKHDHRNTLPFTEADRTSSIRAFEALAGAAGVFGIDAHRSERSRKLNVRGERAANVLSEHVIDELRAEIERLRAELDRARSISGET